MKKRIVRLTESDLRRIVKRVMKEDMGGMDDVHPSYGNLNFSKMSDDDLLNLDPEGTSEYSEEIYDDDYRFSAPSPDDYGDDEEEYYPELRIPSDMPSYKTKYRYRDDENDDFERERQRRLRNRMPESYKKFRRR